MCRAVVACHFLIFSPLIIFSPLKFDLPVLAALGDLLQLNLLLRRFDLLLPDLLPLVSSPLTEECLHFTR